MGAFVKSHVNFIKKVVSSSQIFENNIYTAIPSLIFLASLFVVLYTQFLGGTTYHSKFKTKFTRHAKFHWIYFNSSRLWFIFLSVLRKILTHTDKYIEKYVPNADRNLNTFLTRSTALIIITTLACLPVLVIYLNYVYKSEIPNFLMWVMEDPWLRHEIGISGHCLERPIRIDGTKPKNCSYRSKRSTSFENRDANKQQVLCRNCRSLIERNVVNSLDELIN